MAPVEQLNGPTRKISTPEQKVTDLQEILFPAQVIETDLPVGLEGGGALQDQSGGGVGGLRPGACVAREVAEVAVIKIVARNVGAGEVETREVAAGGRMSCCHFICSYFSCCYCFSSYIFCCYSCSSYFHRTWQYLRW